MINEITINSNNTIEISRGELLSWVNELLKTNLSKIEQLGTGAIYCQLTNVLYPGKVQLSKVNWKAKYQYQFVNNFKVLQQTFTKLGIIKYIDVQKLIKCKYQDNLQFLQWFKKIFDNNGYTAKEYNPIMRRGDTEQDKRRGDTEQDKRRENRESKDNKDNDKRNNSKDVQSSSSKTYFEMNEGSAMGCESFIGSERTDQNDYMMRYSDSKFSLMMANPANSCSGTLRNPHSLHMSEVRDRAFQDERQFYLKKFKQIEHLCQEWKEERPSGELIKQIRKIILVAPNVEWSIEEGEFVETQNVDSHQNSSNSSVCF